MSGQILKNVSRGSFYLATEQFSGLLSGVLYSIIVLRWLGPEGYGLLSLGLAIVGLASVATGNFEVYLERFSAEFETKGLLSRLRRAHFLSLGLKFGLGLVCAVVLVWLSTWLGNKYDEPRLVQLLGVLAGLIVIEGFVVTGRAVLFGLQRFGWVAFAAFVQHGLKVLVVVLLWANSASIMALAAGLVLIAAVNGGILTTLSIIFVRRGQKALEGSTPETVQAIVGEEFSAESGPAPIAEPSLFSSIFKYCLPLLGARAAFLTGQNLSRVVLGAFLSLELLGYFSFAFTVVERFVALVYALPSSLLPSLTQLISRGDRHRFSRLLDKAFRLVATAATTLSFGLFVFARELTLMVGGEEYLPAVAVLQVMAFIPWVRTAQQPLTMSFYALKHTGWVLGLAIVKLATELSMYFILIPQIGVYGAASAHVLGAIMAFVGALFLTGKAFPRGRHRWLVMGKTTTLLFIAASGAMLLDRTGTSEVASITIKIVILTPTFLLSVFLCDLVTEDDLKRAASIDIRPGWVRNMRDAMVSIGLRLSRAVSPIRPTALGTAEGN